MVARLHILDTTMGVFTAFTDFANKDQIGAPIIIITKRATARKRKLQRNSTSAKGSARCASRRTATLPTPA
jgi:hypothetical protein